MEMRGSDKNPQADKDKLNRQQNSATVLFYEYHKTYNIDMGGSTIGI